MSGLLSRNMLNQTSVSIFDSAASLQMAECFEGGRRSSPRRKKRDGVDYQDSPTKSKKKRVVSKKKKTLEFNKLDGLDKIIISPDKVLSATRQKDRDGIANVCYESEAEESLKKLKSRRRGKVVSPDRVSLKKKIANANEQGQLSIMPSSDIFSQYKIFNGPVFKGQSRIGTKFEMIEAKKASRKARLEKRKW